MKHVDKTCFARELWAHYFDCDEALARPRAIGEARTVHLGHAAACDKANVEVMVQNFAKKYLIFLTESCTNSILAKLRDSKLPVKPVHFFCGATACYTIIYSNLHEYEQSIVTGSVFKLMDIIDDALIAADTLNLYKHRTVKLEILHMDMPGLEIFGMDAQFWPESN